MIDRWKSLALKLWTIRLSLFWGAVAGLYGAWDAFQDIIPAWAFASCSMVMSMAIIGARLTKQPGVND